MIFVSSSYWNVGNGRDPGQVKEDAETIQTLETLGKKSAWFLKKSTVRQGISGKHP